jgi:predicted RNase H-like HicB family nuclease
MKTDTTKDAAYYESLPYTVTIRKDDEGDFIARMAELPGCIAHGENESVAIDNLRSVQSLWIEEALKAGNPIPEPEAEAEMPSGKWIQRVPRRLHKQLASAAKLENVSLNQLVTSMLSEALAVRTCARDFDAFLTRMPGPMHQMRDGFVAMWWPGYPAPQAAGWTVDKHPHAGKISATLARVGKIGSSNEVVVVGDEKFRQQLKEHLEEQFAGR